jgi:molybdopterin molybdotransferase
MINVQEADALLAEHPLISTTTKRSIFDLREDWILEEICADRMQPPFHRVAMDGIAISYASWEKGARSFELENFHGAGDPPCALKDTNKAIEVMTGAILPEICDCVIRYEDMEITGGIAYLHKDLKLKLMQNIHQKGSDIQKGDVLVSANSRMYAPHWGAAASAGASTLAVRQEPRIVMISTGNELVEVDKTPKEQEIRRSNVYAVLSALRSCGFTDIKQCHLPDDRKLIRTELELLIESHDVILFSGGVSAGKRDFFPGVLEDLGVKTLFHRVSQRPGKPLLFAKAEQGQSIFGLPGNPVSTLICLHRYVLPYLRKPAQRPFAILREDVEFALPLSLFLPVKLSYAPDGCSYAQPYPVNGSGDFSRLTKSDGFIALPLERKIFKKGEAYPLCLWNQ